ncbi:hypothetical protein ACPCBC_12710 [Streptomyces incarnatus]|nr:MULTISPECIES: hypothetical protein [Streptomyces]
MPGKGPAPTGAEGPPRRAARVRIRRRAGPGGPGRAVGPDALEWVDYRVELEWVDYRVDYRKAAALATVADENHTWV